MDFSVIGKKDPGVPSKCPFKDQILEEAGKVKATVGFVSFFGIQTEINVYGYEYSVIT